MRSHANTRGVTRVTGALVHATNDVDDEIARRAHDESLGETVRFKAPDKNQEDDQFNDRS